MSSSADPSVFVVILAGGSGTRFWPASRRLRPKQLLPLGPSAPVSLLRATVDRLRGLVDESRVLLATGRHLLEATRRELPEVPPENFLAEPVAKNTAPCIAWATALVHQRDPDAVVIVLPSDQHAEDGGEFENVLRRAVASAREGSITTVGVVPTRPETGYGYIEVGSPRGEGRAVERFVEKPNRAVAEGYVASGRFLWNAGMFVFRAKDMRAAFERHLPEVARGAERLAGLFGQSGYDAAVAEFFEQCPSVSIDYAIMEKERGLAVVPGDFGWSDLGSWESAWELATKDESGNAGDSKAVFVDAANNLTLALGERGTKKVIALVGVSDLCVVETDDALLVLPRERSQDVRAVVEALKARGDGGLL